MTVLGGAPAKAVVSGARPAPARLWRLSLVAALLYVAQAIAHIRRGETHDLLWVCNVAPAVLALGCATGRGRVVAIAVCWLAFGTPMWLLDLLGGGSFLFTSVTTHLGGLALGVVALRRLGWPSSSWLAACAGQLGVMLLARLLTAPEFNVNLVHGVWGGWETVFPSYPLYLTLLLCLGAASYYVVERAARWLLGSSADRSPS